MAVKAVDLATAEDPLARERFRREAQATAALSHANVVTVFDFGIDEATALLVMELLPGPSPAGVISERGALPVEEVLGVAEQVAAALAAAHRAGIVHRDIKPGNLMLDGRGHVKVVDLGIARLVESSAKQLTATATVIGSASYMAPEQAIGQPADASTDLYALGCVLMELLTGAPRFTAEQPLAVLHQHLSSTTPRVRDRRPDVDPAVDALVGVLLAKAPTDRPPSADAVRQYIADIHSRVSAGTKVLPTATGAQAEVVAAPPSPATTRASLRQHAEAGPRSRKWIVVVGIGAIVLVAALLLLPNHGPAKPTVQASTPSTQSPSTTVSPTSAATSTQPRTSSTTSTLTPSWPCSA